MSATAASVPTNDPGSSRANPPGASSQAGLARLTSIDAYRGFVMLLMMGEVLRFGTVSRALPGLIKIICGTTLWSLPMPCW